MGGAGRPLKRADFTMTLHEGFCFWPLYLRAVVEMRGYKFFIDTMFCTLTCSQAVK